MQVEVYVMLFQNERQADGSNRWFQYMLQLEDIGNIVLQGADFERQLARSVVDYKFRVKLIVQTLRGEVSECTIFTSKFGKMSRIVVKMLNTPLSFPLKTRPMTELESYRSVVNGAGYGLDTFEEDNGAQIDTVTVEETAELQIPEVLEEEGIKTWVDVATNGLDDHDCDEVGYEECDDVAMKWCDKCQCYFLRTCICVKHRRCRPRATRTKDNELVRCHYCWCLQKNCLCSPWAHTCSLCNSVKWKPVSEPAIPGFICDSCELGPRPLVEEFEYKRRLNPFEMLIKGATILGQELIQGFSRVLARKKTLQDQMTAYYDRQVVRSAMVRSLNTWPSPNTKRKILNHARPQIDEGPLGDVQSPERIESSNVVIETQRVPSVDSTTRVESFSRMSMATEHTQFEQLCSRWYSFANIQWNTTHNVGQKLGEWVLPRDPVVSRIATISNFIPFQTFQYMKGDIEVRAEINSNQFQIGQLQLSWMYGAEEDINYVNLRRNVYNASQRMHTLISAGSSNAASMVIPFKYVTPYLPVRKTKDYFEQNILSMGKLVCLVLNQLSIPDATYKSCTLNFFMKFNNIEFGGMREAKTTINAQPQIGGAIASGARLLSKVSGFVADVMDSNCDKPIAPEPPVVLVPTAMNSLAYTDGIAEQFPTMRSHPLAQTPSLMEASQMDIERITSTYGFVKTYRWSHDKLTGQELFTIPATPIMDNYDSFVKDGSVVQYAPPVACVASMFNLWRGELELRLDVISSKFHTGKFVLYYVAGGCMNETYDYEALKSCPNMVFDLNENRQCTFVIPYVANKPWCERGISAKDVPQVAPPGVVKCYVLNPLIPMESISSTVDINMYVRGVPGKFEVSVPVAPAYGLSYNAKINKPPSNYATCAYVPFFCSYYVYLSSDLVTLFYSNVAGKYCTFTNMAKGKVYSATKCKMDNKIYDFTLHNYKSNTVQEKVNYFVRANVNWSSAVVFCAATYEGAKAYAERGDQSGLCKYLKGGDYCTMYDERGTEVEITKPLSFAVVSTRQPGPLSDQERRLIDAMSPTVLLRRAVAQVGDVNEPTQILDASSPTQYGLHTFGESITSLKSLGRRFNNYCDFQVQSEAVTIIPLCYDRLELDLSDENRTSSDNIYRDGTLPIVFSAFRFARGGLRFKLLCKKSPPASTNILVSFDPEYREVSRAITNERAKLSPNYPTIVQCTRVNEVMEFEVPYYRSGQYNLLQKPSALTTPHISEFFSLGALRVVTNARKPLELSLLYAMADDTLVDEFIGFPPMLPLSEVHNIEGGHAQPQMEINFSLCKVDVPETIQDQVEGTLNGINDTVSDVKEAVAGVNTVVQDNVTPMMVTANDTLGIVQRIMKSIEGVFDWGAGHLNAVSEMLKHVAYYLMSPTVITASFVAYNIICLLFGGVGAIVTKLTGFSNLASILELLLETYLGLGACQTMGQSIAMGYKMEMGKGHAQPQMELPAIVNYANWFLSTFKLDTTHAFKIKKIICGTLDTTGRMAMNANQITRFINDNLKIFRRVWNYMIGLTSNTAPILNLFGDQKGQDTIKTFVKGVALVCSAENEHRVLNSPVWSAIAYRLKRMSVSLSLKLAEEKNVRLSSVLGPYMRKIDELVDKVMRNKINSPIGYEPYVLYLYGKPGIGKSVLIDELLIELLDEINVKSDVNPIYTRSPGVAYWNGLCGQPACKYDDFLQVSEQGDTTLSEFFQLKTDAEFNPPMAAIEDKTLKYNPYIMGICANSLMINSPKVSDNDAVNRRRDMLVAVEYIPGASGLTRVNHSDYTKEQLARKEHLEFFIYSDPVQLTSRGPALKYDEFLQQVKESFKSYTIHKGYMYDQKLKKTMRLLSSDGDDIEAIRKKMDELETDIVTAIDLVSCTAEAQVGNDEAIASILEAFEQSSEVEVHFSRSDQVFSKLRFEKDVVGNFDTIQDFEDAVADFKDVPEFTKDLVFKTDSLEFEKVCVPGVTVDKCVSHSTFLFKTVGYAGSGILNSQGIGTQSACCLHNYRGDVLYDVENDSFVLHDLEVPNTPCSYVDEKGDTVKLNGCLLNNKQFANWYRGQAQNNTIQSQKDPAIKVKGYVGVKTSEDHVIESVITQIEKMKEECEIIDAVPEDVEFSAENDLPIMQRTWVRMKRVTNKIVAMIVKYWKYLVAAVVCMGFATSILTKFVSSGNKSTVDSMIDEAKDIMVYASAEGSGAGKTYDGSGKNYKSNLMRKKLSQRSDRVRAIVSDNFKNSFYETGNFQAESVVENIHMESLTAKVTNNMFFLVCQYGEGSSVYARCLGVAGHKALVPFHYVEFFRHLDKTETCQFHILTSKGVVIRVLSNPLEGFVERLKDEHKAETGLAVVQVPTSMGMFKDISADFIQDETEFPSVGQFTMISQSKGTEIYRETSEVQLNQNVGMIVDPGRGMSGWTIVNGFTYPKQRSGYCGSVIIVNSRARPIIVGMHTAGRSVEGDGISEPILTSYFNEKEARVEPRLQECFTAFDLLEPERAKQQLDTNVTKLATVPSDKCPRQSRTTKIKPSKIQGVYPVTTAPVPLSAQDERLDKSLGPEGYVNPLFCGSRKRGMIPVLMDSDILDECYRDLSAKIVSVVKPIRAKIGKLSMKQSVVGIPELVGYDGIDMTSSEGYPWVLERPQSASSKRWLFETKENIDGQDEVVGVFDPLRRRFEKANCLREQGVVPHTIFQGCLKDERKKLAKIPVPGSTRLFELSPIDATLSHRAYTQDFVAAYTKARLSAEHAIGINPDSIEWTQLYNSLVKFSDKILVADYSNFGPSLQFECIQKAFEIINDWYDVYQHDVRCTSTMCIDCAHEDRKKGSLARRTMAYEIGQSKNICGDLLFQAHCGLPSGCTLTVYLNSLVNCLYMRYAFLTLVKDLGLDYSISDFDKYVKLVVYGDDLIVSVKDEILGWFNNQTIHEVFASLDIKYTDVTKGDEIRPFCSIKDATFLKRSFKVWELRYRSKRSKNVVLAPLDKTVVREIANWTHVSEDGEKSTLETSEASIRMMFGHGCSDYDHNRNVIVKALRKHGLDLPYIPGWNVLANECFPYNDIIPVFGKPDDC